MEDQPISEKIAKICLKMFNSLPKSGKPNSNQWTVLSCIVQEESSNFDVVALGTGSKCIGSNRMSPEGDILNDSHAEVICRRAFMLYLYNQIDRAKSKVSSIFVPNTCSSKFELNAHVKFHFFTTMMPCGDASIFPKCDSDNTGDVVQINNDTKKRGRDFEDSVCKKFKNEADIHRTGAKCLEGGEKQDPKGEGTEYHITGVVRTKPGRGYPTLSVSCSDKILKWCHLGLQGALLSVFLEKFIYLSTFTVAGKIPFSKESLRRAFYERLGNFHSSLVPGQTSLIFQQAEDTEFFFQKSDSREVCPSSIIWHKEIDNRKPEVSIEGKKQGVTKNNLKLESSRLKICKVEMLRKFKSLYQSIYTNIDDLNYSDCKEKASLYQLNWKSLKLRLGNWPEKSEALLKFY